MLRPSLLLIRFYQRHISPHFPAVCRYRPTCSQYAFTAIERYGAIRGASAAATRGRRAAGIPDP